MSFDLLKLFVVIGGSAVLGAISFFLATTTWQRVMSVCFLTGFMLYSGIGVAYPGVPWRYLLYYFSFGFSFVISFKVFCIVFLGFSRHVGRRLPSAFNRIDRSWSWAVIIWAYVGLHIMPLLYPEIRLYQLLSPPSPDLIAAFAARWQAQGTNVFISLLEYVKILLTPFFYVALFRYRSNIPRILLVIMTLLYLEYVGAASIGRGTVLMGLMVVVFALWMKLPRYRVVVVVGSGVLLPIFLAVAYLYSVVRIGGTAIDFSFWRVISVVLVQETSFPVFVGMPIIEGNVRADLGGYFRWIATLPIPKILTGEIAGARINYEISEYVLGIGRGLRGFYVVLPGLLAEAVYIYGRYFYWLHGVFVAFLAAFVVRLVERTPQLLFLAFYSVVLFAFVLNRAGIAALLPVVVNGYLFFYLFIFVKLFRLLPTRRNKRRDISDLAS